MKATRFFALLALAGTLTAADKLPVLNYTFTAKTMADSRSPGINDDPGFRKLTDGKINRDGGKSRYGRILFRHIENKEKPVVITFNFRNPVKLSEAKVHYFRWHRNEMFACWSGNGNAKNCDGYPQPGHQEQPHGSVGTNTVFVVRPIALRDDNAVACRDSECYGKKHEDEAAGRSYSRQGRFSRKMTDDEHVRRAVKLLQKHACKYG